MDEEVGYAFHFESHYLGQTKQGYKLHAPLVRLAGPTSPTGGASVGVSAALAARFAKAMDALVKLGVGTHAVAVVVNALADVANISVPSGRRPNFKSKLVQQGLADVFTDQLNFAYGSWIVRVTRDYDGHIESVSLLHAT